MNKYEKIYLKAAERSSRASWMDCAITALALDIEEATGKPVTISGPFGIRCEVLICVGEEKSERKFIRVTPEFPGKGFKIYYDTGETKDRFAPGTIGYINGMNCVSAPLPDTLEEILKLLKPY